MAPRGGDDLPWTALRGADGVYLTGGDLEAGRHARAARILVATPRATEALDALAIDALVYSANDRVERDAAASLSAKPALTVATDGANGGSWMTADGIAGRWEPARPPRPAIDQYGAGDSFAAGLTYGLAAGRSISEAVELAVLPTRTRGSHTH